MYCQLHEPYATFPSMCCDPRSTFPKKGYPQCDVTRGEACSIASVQLDQKIRVFLHPPLM